MRKAEDIYNDSKIKCFNNNCQSSIVIALNAIEMGRKEMFDYIYSEAHIYNEENNESNNLTEFLDYLDKNLSFDY